MQKNAHRSDLFTNCSFMRLSCPLKSLYFSPSTVPESYRLNKMEQKIHDFKIFRHAHDSINRRTDIVAHMR